VGIDGVIEVLAGFALGWWAHYVFLLWRHVIEKQRQNEAIKAVRDREWELGIPLGKMTPYV
jgi:hypothetical protein